MSACPSPGNLRRLLLGQLPEAEMRPLEQHFLQCDSCIARAQTMQVEDTFAEALRSQAGAEDEPETDVVERLIGRVKQLGPSTRPSASDQTGAGVAYQPTIAGTIGHDPNPGFQQGPDLIGFLAPAQEPDELGRLGPYRVLKVLGHGGMGAVFQAHDPRADRQIALKVMLPQLAVKPEARDRFLREARATAAIEHDHIVPLYQVDEDRGVPFLAMPLLRGKSLEDWLKARPRPKAPVELPRLLRIGKEVALGLAAAHERGLIHRDIKPANLWLDAAADDRIKILDFGLARPADADAHLTTPGMIVGTAAYMPPEQARGLPVDFRADLYSLGCVLYRLSSGRLPFTGEDAMSLLIAAATEPATPVFELNPELPAPVGELIMQLLAKDPADRPASAREVAGTLQALERQYASPDHATAMRPQPTAVRRRTAVAPPAAKKTPPVQTPRRKAPLVAAVLVLAAGALAAGALYHLKRTPVAQGLGPSQVEDTGKGVAQGPRKEDDSDNEPPPGDPADVGIKTPPLASQWTLGKDKLWVYLVAYLDAQNLLTVSGGTVSQYDVVTGQQRWSASLSELRAKYGTLNRAALSRDGRLLALAKYDIAGTPVVFWDVKERKEIGTLTLPDGRTSALAFSPGGTVLATAGKDPVIRLWDVKAHKEVGTLPGHEAAVSTLAFSPDGSQLVSGGDDDSLKFWDVPNRKLIRSIPFGQKGIAAVNYSADGKTVAATQRHNGTGACFDAATGKKGVAFPSYAGVFGPAFSPDGRFVLSQGGVARGAEGYRLYLTDSATGRVRAVTATEHSGAIHGVAYSPDGRTVASASRDGTAKVWEVARVARPSLDEAWLKTAAGLSGEKLIDEVVKHLRERNPRGEFKVLNRNVQNPGNRVTGLGLEMTGEVIDLEPLRILKELDNVTCRGALNRGCELDDLSPLADLKKLTYVDCSVTRVSDLTPLKDLTNLQNLNCANTPVQELAPLKGLKLRTLHATGARVENLDALADQRDLKVLNLTGTRVRELKPLRGLTSLELLTIDSTPARDLTPLRDLPLKILLCAPDAVAKNADLLGKIKTLKTINNKSAGDLLKATDEIEHWIKETSDLPGDRQLDAVLKKLQERNRDFDGKVKKKEFNDKGSVSYLSISADGLTDLTPLRGLPSLKTLWCEGGAAGSALSDLTPLRDSKLEVIHLNRTAVRDLSPLAKLPLRRLFVTETAVDDLAPLQGTPVSVIHCQQTGVRDITPLQAMDLTELSFDFIAERDTALLRKMPKLEKINNLSQADFLKQADEEVAWLQKAAKLSPKELVEEVRKRLKERNKLTSLPALEGKPTSGPTTEVILQGSDLTDLRPLRAFTGLKRLSLLHLPNLSDLRPLAGMDLSGLNVTGSKVVSLAPLEGMRLRSFTCKASHVRDLTPLQNMPLREVLLSKCNVSDLTPLAGMKLEELSCDETAVHDLTPLRDMPLRILKFDGLDMKRDLPVLRTLKDLQKLNDVAPKLP